MRIAIINEDSQAEKNAVIYAALCEVGSSYGHEVINFGMLHEHDVHEINYTQIGILSSIIIECGLADFVITGCGTGQGAMMSCNAFPNLYCGYVHQPLDAYLFAQVNAGNCISIPFAQSFGWGSEINLRYIFESLFEKPFGGGYPERYAIGEKKSRENFKQEIKERISKSVVDAIQSLRPDYLKSIIQYEIFKEYFKKFHRSCALSEYIKELLCIGEEVS